MTRVLPTLAQRRRTGVLAWLPQRRWGWATAEQLRCKCTLAHAPTHTHTHSHIWAFVPGTRLTVGAPCSLRPPIACARCRFEGDSPFQIAADVCAMSSDEGDSTDTCIATVSADLDAVVLASLEALHGMIVARLPVPVGASRTALLTLQARRSAVDTVQVRGGRAHVPRWAPRGAAPTAADACGSVFASVLRAVVAQAYVARRCGLCASQRGAPSMDRRWCLC